MEKIFDVRRRQYGRPALICGTWPAVLSAVTVSSLRDTIKAVVQEKLRKLFPSSCPQAATLSGVVRQEVQQALGTAPLVPPNKYLSGLHEDRKLCGTPRRMVLTDSQRRRVRSEIVHVVRLKPYYAR
ncbi:hypothetical protein HPB50_020306 [Hyalomma asiaticum]|uniref:Uncharacterized protein n=1 Tax=Hyalomma asiaticum TaxID=266040 RepID=A0ACB7RYU2_HYAAI|nr:hypothetical protein HPB50_020306 [Hyalomma asiaticum]